jgi:hypothetical protein
VGGIRLDERTSALVRAERRLDAPLVGRDEELTHLASALATAREAGRCRVVTVVGEPGIGKTRLARELALREREGTTVLVARCIAHGAGVTFLPLLGALRRAKTDQALAHESDAELVLGRLAALATGGQTAPLGESYWAVRRLLEALARRQPVLLVLDDVHWAEPALLDLVDYLAERVDGPLLVLCLARPELARPLGERLELGPLDEEEARAVVAGTADLAEQTRERIVELAEGNALYAEQLASFAVEGGEGLPPTLEAVLAGRLGRLDSRERAVLQRAAVLGREFSLGAVAALADGEVAHELLSLSRHGFVHAATAADPGDDGYTFHHVLLRDAAYASLTKADRADLHERAVAWIDRDGPGDDAIAGYHLEQAVLYRRELGEDADELAATAGERLAEAGMRVWRTNDVAAATSVLGRAAALLPAGPRRAELLWERSIALRLQGAVAEADSALAQAGLEARDTGARSIAARVEAERTQVILSTGELPLDEAVTRFDEALSTLREEGDHRGLGRAGFCACIVHAFACNFAADATAAEEAAKHYRAAGFSDAACIGRRAEALFYGATDVGTASLACSAMLETELDRLSEANVTSVLGGLRALAGDVDDGLALLDRAHELYEDAGSKRSIEFVWTPLRVEAELIAGDTAGAAARAASNVEELMRIGERAFASTRALQLAGARLLLGDEPGADRWTSFAEENALASDVLPQFLRRSLRARLLARAGAIADAEGLARDALRLAMMTDALLDRARAHVALAEVLLLAGDEAGARMEEEAADALLRLKGVKGARLGAPPTKARTA